MDDFDPSPPEDLNILSQESYNRLLQEVPQTEQWSTILENDEAAGFQNTTVELNHFLVNEDLQPIGVPAGGYTQLQGQPPRIEEPQPPLSSSVVITEPFEGEYSFFITCPDEEKRTKSTHWTYAAGRRKLFVNMNVSCPFHIHVKKEPPFGSTIRAMAVFSQSNHAKDVVKCCPVHVSKGSDTTSHMHLIKCDVPGGTYLEDTTTGRHSVVSQFLKAEAGMTHSVYLYKFSCLSSCIGGMNRRPIKLVFTLEHGKNILGRFSMDVKICACPGRDRATEDRQLQFKVAKAESNGQVKRGSPVEANFVSVVPIKKAKTSDEEGYNVKCTDENTYNLLNAMAKWMNAVKQNDQPASTSQPTQSILLTQLLNASAQGQCQTSRPSSTGLEQVPSDLSRLAEDLEESVTVKSEMDVPCTKNTSLESWLTSLNLSSCCQELQRRGYTNVKSLRRMTLKEAKVLPLAVEEKLRLLEGFLCADVSDSDEDEQVPLSQRSDHFNASQESTHGDLSQVSHASSMTSQRSFTVTHVRIRTQIKDEHNYT